MSPALKIKLNAADPDDTASKFGYEEKEVDHFEGLVEFCRD